MSILTKDLRNGDRILCKSPVDDKYLRCIVHKVDFASFTVEIIEVDRWSHDIKALLFGLQTSEKYREWGVTKEFKMVVHVMIDLDHADVECLDVEVNRWSNDLNKIYDGAITVSTEEHELVEVTKNELPMTQNARAEKIEQLRRLLTEFYPEIIADMREKGPMS